MRDARTLAADMQMLLAECREASRPGLTGAELAGARWLERMVVYGRVDGLVSEDPVFGPHLRVIRQSWSGAPPTVGDGSEVPERCCPEPGRVLSDYATGEYVRIGPVYGAMVAEKLA